MDENYVCITTGDVCGRKSIFSKCNSYIYLNPHLVEKKNTIILLILLFLHLLTLSVKGQRRTYAISAETPFFYKNYQKHNSWKLYFIKLELLNKKSENYFNSFKLGVGIGPLESISSAGAISFSYSRGLLIHNHFFELGAGLVLTHPFLFLNAKVGYRYYFQRFIFQVAYNPSRWIGGGFFGYDGGPYNKSFHGLNIGIGYKFKQFLPKEYRRKIFKPFRSIQLETYSFSYSENARLSASILLKIEMALFQRKKTALTFSVGKGLLGSGRGFSFTGIGYLQEIHQHQIEASLNLLFATLLNPNYGWRFDRYKLLQPQLGYRYQCQKIPMFARIAYAPYIRTLDWKREGGLHHNMVLGVGYRFGK